MACLNLLNPDQLALAAVWCLASVAASFFLEIRLGAVCRRLPISAYVVAMVILGGMGMSFYDAMMYSSQIKRLAQTIGIDQHTIVLGMAIAGAAAASIFCLFLLGAFLQTAEGTQEAFERAENRKGCARRSVWIQTRWGEAVVLILAAIGCALSVMSSLNGYIWADEAFSLRIAECGVQEIISRSADDVHPPLYYLLLSAAQRLGGCFSSGYYASVVIGNLLSVVPYVLLTCLCWRRFKGMKDARAQILLCLFGMPQMLQYAGEIRMYSWAMLFVTASFLYAREIMLGDDSYRSWTMLTIFSLLSAYTHTFALIAMASIWLYLLIWGIWDRRRVLRRWFGYGCAVAVGFFPWLLVLLRQVGYVSASYWIPPITIQTIWGYVLFMAGGAALLIPYVLYVGLRSKPIDRQSRFVDGFGILVPLTTIAVGVVVSWVIRPVFVARYMVPGLMCLWISVVLLSRRCNRVVRSIVGALIVLCALGSYASSFTAEKAKRQMACENMALVESLEEDAVLIVSNNSHVTDTLAVYAPEHDVYDWHGSALTEATQKYREVYENGHVFDDARQIGRWLEAGKAVYYFEVKNSETRDRLSAQEAGAWSLERVGTYSFEYDTEVYRIAL